ncbi:transporter substrate-binding domain-containing protein [soil metagenome]
MITSFSNAWRLRAMHLLVCILAWFVSAGDVHAQNTSITIAAEDDWPPYSAIKPGTNEVEGFTPDLVREVFKIKGVDVKYAVVPYSRCMNMVKTGKAVACFNTNKNEENSPEYYWHNTPIFDEGVSFFALSDVPGNSLVTKDLEGSMVGVTQGYAYSPAFMRNEKIQKVAVNSDDQLLKMLIAKRVKFVLMNTLPGLLRIKNDPAYAGKIRQVGVLDVHGFFLNFSKADPNGKAMADLFEAGLVEFKKSGKYDKMYGEFRDRIGVPR